MTVAADLPIGGELAGYRIEAPGQGGMGVVYLAEHVRLKPRRLRDAEGQPERQRAAGPTAATHTPVSTRG